MSLRNLAAMAVLTTQITVGGFAMGQSLQPGTLRWRPYRLLR